MGNFPLTASHSSSWPKSLAIILKIRPQCIIGPAHFCFGKLDIRRFFQSNFTVFARSENEGTKWSRSGMPRPQWCSIHFSVSNFIRHHYIDVIMTTMTSQITSLTVVYSTVYSDADQRKHQSSASLAFVWGIHRGRWIPRTKGQLRGKCFHLMTSSWPTHEFKIGIDLFIEIETVVSKRGRELFIPSRGGDVGFGLIDG